MKTKIVFLIALNFCLMVSSLFAQFDVKQSSTTKVKVQQKKPQSEVILQQTQQPKIPPVAKQEDVFKEKNNNSTTGMALLGYSKQTLKLPFSNELKEYIVRKRGHYYILNDDIIVGNDFPKTMSYGSKDRDYKWHNAEIPVVIDNSVFERNMQGMVYNALNSMNKQLEISIIPHTNQEDYVRISVSSETEGAAGSSYVGRQGGEQILMLAPNVRESTVWHEMIHAAGIYHEQSRSDRNNFVRIREENVEAKKAHNFQIEPGIANSAYDYCSIMHYSPMAFSKNGQSATIECLSKNPSDCACMGQRNQISPQDISGLDRFYNEVSRFPSNYVFNPPTNAAKGIASVSRQPNAIENWWIDHNGTIQAAYWYEGNNWSRYQIGTLGGASINGGIAAVSRAKNAMEVWWVGSNGSIQGAFWYEGQKWKLYELAPAGSAALTSSIVAVSRVPNSMEVWWVGSNGSVQGAFWYDGQPWKRYELAPAGSASVNGGITALSRVKNSMEIWWVGANNSIQAAFWYEGQSWKRYELAPAGSASNSGRIAAVSRVKNAMEVWWVGGNNSVQGAFWYEGQPWKRYELAPAGSASANGGIDAVSRIPNSMEVWWVGSNGSIQGKYWYEGGNWNGYELAPGGSASPSSNIAAVSRIPNSMEFWWIGSNGSVQSNFWYDKSNWKRYELGSRQ